MEYLHRSTEHVIEKTLDRGKSLLLLGARQTGKTTLLGRFPADYTISLIQPAVRQRYERNASLLTGEIESLAKRTVGKKPLVLLDEIQKVPELMDAVQDLIDRRLAQFMLTGSSARKLRTGKKINLLPGRVVVLQLDPLTLRESSSLQPSLSDLLLYGSLPGIMTVQDPSERERDLISYVSTYLEEEIRAEALVRSVGMFARFLLLAASESGNLINYHKLSQEIGISHTTIAGYFQILEDCLIAERVDPYVHTATRRRLTKSSKYIFFDLGIRRTCAEEGFPLPNEYMGKLFEQWVGLELIRCARLSSERINIHFWRDPDGPEVDWIIKKNNELIPVEVKWTAFPDQKDIRHLELFLKEYHQAQKGFVVCQSPERVQLTPHIEAIPWTEVDSLIE